MTLPSLYKGKTVFKLKMEIPDIAGEIIKYTLDDACRIIF